MQHIGLWLRWSRRDLAQRWLVVTALALVIAIGTGAAAAFGSLSNWRRLSNDASFALLGMHDVKVTFADTLVPAEDALAAVRGIPGETGVRAVATGLDVPSQVEVVSEGKAMVLAGRVVGIDINAGGPRIDRLDPVAGRPLTAIDELARDPVGVLETAFAEEYRLPPTGTVRVAGGRSVSYVGTALSPQYLLNGQGAWLGEPMQAVVFLPLSTAQRLASGPAASSPAASGSAGPASLVNQLLITVRRGVDRDSIRREVVEALATALPGAPATVTTREEDPTYRILYEDIDNDQKMWDFIAVLVLGGAALATFNLTNRVITAQRREIGVGAALGLRAPALAIRPLLFGAQVAALGILAGIGVGALLGWGITGILHDVLPLPRWRTPVQIGAFAQAAALGLGIPLLGVAFPVWRAVRVTPAEAIRTAHVSARAGVLSRALRRLPLPGNSIGHLPVRHLLRSPGRTALTATGIGAAITVLVAMFGLLDSFGTAMDDGERELAGGTPGRTLVTLDTFRPVDDPAVTAVSGLPQIRQAQPGLRLTASARTQGSSDEIDLIVDVLDFRTSMWTPTLLERDGQGQAVPSGLVLAEKAAADLKVRPGDSIVLEHPRRVGANELELVTSSIQVSAIHPHPMRAFAYLDAGQAGIFGMRGLTNLVQVRPRAGVGEDELRRTLLGNQAIGSVSSVTSTSRALRDMLAEFTGILRLLGLFVLVLALLIAFNAASISADERSREHATMFAFGLRVNRALRNAMVESVLIGVLGTIIGIAAGGIALRWMIGSLLNETLPELAIAPSITWSTVLAALVIGVLAVTIAPLLTVRRLFRINIPAALRVVE